MPTFEIATPKGKYRVTAPDENAALEALRSEGLMQEPVGTVEDVARSGATGLRQGIEGVAGMFGDAAKMGGDIAAWGAGKLGAGEGAQDMIRKGARYLTVVPNAPTTQEIQGLTKPVIGEHYQPQTTAGEYARTGGQFLPGAMLGPGAMGRKLMTGAGAALTSETAGQLTKGTRLEPYARAAGAFAGGLAGSAIPMPGRSRAPALPSADDIKASAGYEALKPEMQAARVTTETYRDIVGRLRAVADDFGMVPEQHAAFQRILARHTKASGSSTPSLQDLEILRRSLANAGQTTDASARALSGKLIAELDSAIEGLGGSNVMVGAGRTAENTIKDLQTARSTWRTAMKSEMIEGAMEKARNTASGFENGLRVEFRKILNSKTLSRSFDQTELSVMRQIVQGSFKGNMLRWLGGFGVPLDNGRNFLGSVMGGGVGSTLGAAVAGPMGAAVGGPLLVGIGTAAKAASAAGTRNTAQVLEALVKAGPSMRKAVGEALIELQTAQRAGLVRSGVNAMQALQSTRERERQR